MLTLRPTASLESLNTFLFFALWDKIGAPRDNLHRNDSESTQKDLRWPRPFCEPRIFVAIRKWQKANTATPHRTILDDHLDQNKAI